MHCIVHLACVLYILLQMLNICVKLYELLARIKHLEKPWFFFLKIAIPVTCTSIGLTLYALIRDKVLGLYNGYQLTIEQ